MSERRFVIHTGLSTKMRIRGKSWNVNGRYMRFNQSPDLTQLLRISGNWNTPCCIQRRPRHWICVRHTITLTPAPHTGLINGNSLAISGWQIQTAKLVALTYQPLMPPRQAHSRTSPPLSRFNTGPGTLKDPLHRTLSKWPVSASQIKYSPHATMCRLTCCKVQSPG